MKLYINSERYIDTQKGFDISIPVKAKDAVRAWYLDNPVFEPVRENGFIGSVQEGGSVNFRNISFNPHGHGTHTECLGHITEEVYSINQHLDTYFFNATLISITPNAIQQPDGSIDLCITLSQLKEIIQHPTEALVIRTLPNSMDKKHFNYSNTNAPYLSTDLIPFFESLGIKHLLIDMPSVDKESDGGVLAFHHAFWGVPNDLKYDKTITELVYIDDKIPDGDYILNLQVAAFENDAAPSRPVLYQIEKGE